MKNEGIYNVDRAMLGDLQGLDSQRSQRDVVILFCAHLRTALSEAGISVEVRPIVGLENGAENHEDLVPEAVWNGALDALCFELSVGDD